MLHSFIIAAQTLDGFIARDSEQNSMSWTSGADKKRFVELTKRAGVVIMGSKTFETIGRPLKDRLNIVYSKSGKVYPGAETTSKTPTELLQELETRGYKEVAVCGGSSIYSLFMNAGVVDTLYLTIEPVLFGTGVPLFSKPVSSTLELVSTEKSGNTLMLEYKITK